MSKILLILWPVLVALFFVNLARYLEEPQISCVEGYHLDFATMPNSTHDGKPIKFQVLGCMENF